jgi:hypothetical protein
VVRVPFLRGPSHFLWSKVGYESRESLVDTFDRSLRILCVNSRMPSVRPSPEINYPENDVAPSKRSAL